MNLHITKSKNAESFYICKSYVKASGSTSSTIVRKLGTLEFHPTQNKQKCNCNFMSHIHILPQPPITPCKFPTNSF